MSVRGLSAAFLITAILAAVAIVHAASAPGGLRVVATNLNNPRKLFVAADGSLYVAEAGSGGTTCVAKTCTGTTSSVTRVAQNAQKRVVTGLPSAASAHGGDAEGAADVIVSGSRYEVLLGNGRVTASTGITGDLISTSADKVAARVLADFGAFEAARDPDSSGKPALDSNPYAVVAYRGGYAVVDAAGNDLLWLSPQGKISVLAVFPAQKERVKTASLTVQSVPTSVAVGPDGALYVGELTGYPFQVGKARIWRVMPGQKATVYASGFTNISDLAFEGDDLLVLEIAADGLSDASSPGALIRLEPNGTRTVIASKGRVSATGLAVTDGTIYISNYGTSPATGAGHHGEIVSLKG